MKLELLNVNTNKIHDELIANGIIPRLVESFNNTTWITVDDSQHDAVMIIVAKHDTTPLPQPKTELEILQENQALIQEALNELILGGM